MITRSPFFWMTLLLTALLMHCEKKSAINISGYTPTPPASSLVIVRDNLKASGSFLPGYESGNIRSDRITISWSPVNASDFSSYRIFRNDILLTTITDRQQSSYTDSVGLTPNTFYNYRLSLLTPQGLSTADTILIKTPQWDPPAKPGGQVLGPTAAAIRIFWTNQAESNNRFNVYRKFNNEPLSSFFLIGTSTDTNFTDDISILAGAVYDYRISAVNDFETTAFSEILTFEATYTMNSPTLSGIIQLPGSRSLRIEWDDNASGEDGFRIWRRDEQNIYAVIDTVSTNSAHYIDTDTTNSLVLGTTYTYAVSAFDATNESLLSNPLALTIGVPTTFDGFSDSFEQPPGNEWEFVSSAPEGRITPSPLGANTGQQMLLMDVAQDGIVNLNHAILRLDLSGISNTQSVVLSFFYNTFDDEVSPLEELVEISSDGINWETIYTMSASPFDWTEVLINLQDFIATQPYSANYHIRFQQQDNFPFPTDGIGIDDVSVQLNQ